MGAYKYINQLYKKKQSNVVRFLQRVRSWEYRQQSKIVRVSRPTRVERARRLGYKAKNGFVIYRVRIRRGTRKRPAHRGIINGKPSSQGITAIKHARNLQVIAEGRVGKRCPNLRVLNSYWVAQDAKYKWFEVILVDPFHEAIRMDPQINWICKKKHKHRELRGRTTAGRKARGLIRNTYATSHQRPSKKAYWRRQNRLNLARKR